MKEYFLVILKHLGINRIFRWFYRNKLLILCYHGISIQDEHLWWPGVFMTEEKFRTRLELLKQCGFTIIPLNDAISGLKNNSLPRSSIVLTADDGYANSPESIVKQCESYNFPISIYITSYYAAKCVPIFNVMVQYLFWKTDRKYLVGDFSFDGSSGQRSWSLEGEKKKLLIRKIIDYGHECCNNEERQKMLSSICEALDMNFDEMSKAGMFRLMNGQQISEILSRGVDIQLHTHRHRFPVNEEIAKKEILENRAFLEPITKRRLEHFCYPSGRWDQQQHPWLRSMSIRSATTCQIGFNDRETNPLALKRYIDRQDISENEFLAEVSGVSDFLRKVKRSVKSIWK